MGGQAPSIRQYRYLVAWTRVQDKKPAIGLPSRS